MSGKESPSFLWEEYTCLPTGIRNPQILLLNDQLYLGGVTYSAGSLDEQAKLFTYDSMVQSSSASWQVVGTPTYWFALASYQSLPVLVGGYEDTSRQRTDKLYSLLDQKFVEHLPPMTLKRSAASAVSGSVGLNSEVVVVAGGWSEYGPVSSVEVYSDGKWCITQPVPGAYRRVRCLVEDGNLYVIGGSKYQLSLYCASLESLVSSLHGYKRSGNVFKKVVIPFDGSYLTVFGSWYLSFEGKHKDPFLASAIRAYSVVSKSWVVGSHLPIPLSNFSVVKIPSSKEFLVIGGKTIDKLWNLQVFKATFKETGVSAQRDSEGDVMHAESYCDVSVLDAGSPGVLRGVEVVAQTSVVVTNLEQSFNWSGYGFKLHIPQDSLPADVDKCLLHITASVSGQYQFPDYNELVSAVYWIRSDPPCRFKQHLTAELQHCAKVSSSTKLTFVRAICTQEVLPYVFKHLKGHGSLSNRSSYGSIHLDHFSGLAITGDDIERMYAGSLFYLGCGIHSREIHFVITWDDEPHISVVRKHYMEKGAVEGSFLAIEYDKDLISLDIPMQGITSQDWLLVPLVQPSLSRKRVDHFKPGRQIPCCQLRAKYCDQSETGQVPELLCPITLIGTKEPNCFITIEIHRKPDSHPENTGVSAKQTVNVRNLLNELSSVVHWYRLGTYLGIPTHLLQKIKLDHCDTDDRKVALIDLMVKNYKFTWEDICRALECIDEANIARSIRQKFLS